MAFLLFALVLVAVLLLIGSMLVEHAAEIRDALLGTRADAGGRAGFRPARWGMLPRRLPRARIRRRARVSGVLRPRPKAA